MAWRLAQSDHPKRGQHHCYRGILGFDVGLMVAFHPNIQVAGFQWCSSPPQNIADLGVVDPPPVNIFTELVHPMNVMIETLHDILPSGTQTSTELFLVEFEVWRAGKSN